MVVIYGGGWDARRWAIKSFFRNLCGAIDSAVNVFSSVAWLDHHRANMLQIMFEMEVLLYRKGFTRLICNFGKNDDLHKHHVRVYYKAIRCTASNRSALAHLRMRERIVSLKNGGYKTQSLTGFMKPTRCPLFLSPAMIGKAQVVFPTWCLVAAKNNLTLLISKHQLASKQNIQDDDVLDDVKRFDFRGLRPIFRFLK